MNGLTLDLNLAKMLDFHSTGREVLVGFLCVDVDERFDNYLIDVPILLVSLCAHLHFQEGVLLADKANYDWRRPSADGEHHEWVIANATGYAWLVETHTDFQPTYASALAEADRVWPMVQVTRYCHC